MANKMNDAVLFLCDVLAGRSLEFKDIMQKADKKNISRRALYRAAHQLGVRRRVTGFGADRSSLWSLSKFEAQRYRRRRLSRLHSYRIIEKSLLRASARAAEDAYAFDVLQGLLRDVRRQRRKLQAKGVDNS